MATELPIYECHKRVRAAKIVDMHRMDDGGVDLVLDNGAKHWVSEQWRSNHMPRIGGYLVIYEDNYESYSPPGPFEAGYSLVVDKVPEQEQAL